MNNEIVMSLENDNNIDFNIGNNEDIGIGIEDNNGIDIGIDSDNNNIVTEIAENQNVSMNIEDNNLSIDFQMADTPVASNNYNDLVNKPKINSVTLIHNKTSDELGLQPAGEYANSKITNIEIDNLFR